MELISAAFIGLVLGSLVSANFFLKKGYSIGRIEQSKALTLFLNTLDVNQKKEIKDKIVNFNNRQIQKSKFKVIK